MNMQLVREVGSGESGVCVQVWAKACHFWMSIAEKFDWI